MKPFFTCYIEGTGDRWTAACVDFDLTVFGSTIEETKRLLESVVRSYVHDANQEAEPDRTRLLNRKSPWSTRLAWRLEVLASHVGRRVRRAMPVADSFALPCPS